MSNRWRPRLAVAAAMALSIGPAAAGPAETEEVVEEPLAAAEAAFAAADYKAALKAFEKAAGATERPAEALSGVARAQSALGRNDKAILAAEAAILAAAGSPAVEAAAHQVSGLVRVEAAIDLWIEIRRLSDRPGKKKPTYGEQVREHFGLAEASYRRALELTDGEMPAAWHRLVELLALTGRFLEARDELVLYFEHDPAGRDANPEILAHLECVSDVSDLADIVRPGMEGVAPATKQFSPSPRASGVVAAEKKRPPKWRSARVVGVVDREGRYRCLRILNAVDFPPEVLDVFVSVLATWRFEPARLEGERRAAFFADTVTSFERP